MTFENYHRLPVSECQVGRCNLSYRMRGFHLTEEDSLNGFLESFPNLEGLESGQCGLASFFFVGGDAGRSLPPAISQLKHLSSLNLLSHTAGFQ